MGCCCSQDSLPPVPKVIRPDPNPLEIMDVVVVKIGFFGRDYGIYDKVYPDNSHDRQELIWLWFNKSNKDGNIHRIQIDLENFVRGHIDGNPDQGRVLYSARLSEKPMFNLIQKKVDDGLVGMMYGLFTGNYKDPNDRMYVDHPNHEEKLRAADGITLQPEVLIRWSFSSIVQIFDGDLGRGAAVFGRDPIMLEVFAKGAAVTTYKRWERTVTTYDEDGKPNGHRKESGINKVESTFVDRIEFRLSFRGSFWAEWFVQGDSFIYGAADATIDCPLFTTVVMGGWFSGTKFHTTTKYGVDPALAILIAQVCATEFSVGVIKSELQVNTPPNPPSQFPAVNIPSFVPLPLQAGSVFNPSTATSVMSQIGDVNPNDAVDHLRKLF